MNVQRIFPLSLMLAGLSAAAVAQQLVLPDNTNFIASTAVSTAWRSTAGRFQICYDTTHFTNAGVTGPITINRLQFRPNDGIPTTGGQVYTGVTVELGTCTANFNALSTTFATNRGTMGALGTTNVTLLPATGTLPNNNVVDIDLVALGASLVYDPTLGNDLLIDVSFPVPVPSTSIPLFSAGSSTVLTARARMMTTGTAGSPTGSSSAPPICTVDFTGGGGYAAPVPARLDRYGHGCAAASFRSYYQDWRTGESFDLSNTSITMTPDNVLVPTSYTVTMGATAPDMTKLDVVPDSTAASALVTHALGFTFNYVSGSTATIKPYTKGYVWLDSLMTIADGSPSVNELLSRAGANLTARLAPCWTGIWDASKNVSSHPNAGMHIITDTSAGPGNAVCYVTWYKIGRADVATAGLSVSDFQVVLYEATGVMEMRFGNVDVSPVGGVAITGWSPGKVAGVESSHPGPFDLSHELSLLPLQIGTDTVSVHAMTHDLLSQARPIFGTTVTPQAFNLPAGQLMALMIVDVAPLQPSVPIPGILAAGCGLSLSPSFWVYDSLVLPPAGSWNALPLLIDPAWATMGLQFYSQVALLDGAVSNVLTTNALKYTVGLQ